MRWKLSLLLALLPSTLVHSLAATDEIQDADLAQSGYMDNHNLHPATVGTSIFGLLWKNNYGAKEKWYAKPLVYTPTGGSQVVFLASNMNNLRVLDAVNGTLLGSRQVQSPFLQSDVGCTDMPDYIGIAGTPVIDPATNTAYFFSKGYKGGAASGGVVNGVYQFYAVDVLTLQDRPGFPVLIDGHNADNDPTRYFLGGTVLNRVSLAMVNGVVIGGFGGHCDLFNYTGMLVSVSTTPDVGVTSIYAMEASPGAPAVTSTDPTVQNGGKAGLWAGGMAIAVDGSRIFVATGNGQGHANGDVPASGRTPLTTLDEVVGNFAVSTSGKITLTDYFEPYDYVNLDAGDRDIGSSGVTLLDPTTFSGTGVSRMAVTIGKNGKAYIMNANNLGGFKQGSGGTDNIIQSIIGAGSVFGGVGSYPLEGGYIYFTPVGSPTVAYKMGLDSNGAPIFSLAGQSSTNGAGRVGIGIPTLTSYKGQAGTGILWIADPSAGLQAFQAVPVGGNLVPIPIPPTGGLNKFLRPAFGDGRVYVSDSSGNVICLGSPVALPLSCTQPVNFGDLPIGLTATQTINCTALIAISSINGCIALDKTFACSNSTLPTGALAKGATFSFPVTWNLTQDSINSAQNASPGKVTPGIVGTSLDIYTTNGASGFSSVLPISLTGNAVSQSAYLSISPPAVDLGGLVVGSASSASGLTGAVAIQNLGAQSLTFLGVAWTNDNPTGGGSVTYTNITNGDLGNGFTSSSIPKAGDALSSGASVSVPLGFYSSQTGTYATFVNFWTTGGMANVLLGASAATAQVANISIGISQTDGPWNYSQPSAMNFGNVVAGTTVSQYIRICNSGGSALHITKSKPPIDTELLAPNADTDLHEGQDINVNSCATGQVSIVAAPESVNVLDHSVSNVWTLNVDDTTFGIHEVPISANIVSRQVGPLLNNGSAEYLYLGCYFDGGGRLLSKQFNNATNENGWCQNTCFKAGYKFAGTEYHTECWCGNTAPTAAKFSANNLKKCGFSCPGDTTQACGGDGTFVSIFYDRTRYVPGPDSLPGLGSPSSSSSALVTKTSSVSTVSSLASSTNTFTPSLPSTSVSATSSINSLSSTTPISSQLSSVSPTTSQTPQATGFVPGNAAYSLLGCFAEPAGSRALSKLYGNDSMTIEMCLSYAAGFAYAGVEYGRECWYGNTLNVNASNTIPTTPCSKILCPGNKAEYCGNGGYLVMYTKNPVTSTPLGSTSSLLSSVTSTSSISLSATPTISSTPLSPVPTPTPTLSSSSSLQSSTTSSVTLSSSSSLQSSTTSSVTLSSSSPLQSSTVSSVTLSSSSPLQSSTISSVTLSSSSTLQSSTISSITPSSSSPLQSSTVSSVTLSSSSSLRASTVSSAPPSFTSLGCYSDPAGGPVGGHNMRQILAVDGMTPQLCISAAMGYLPTTTYLFAGVEYGRECYAATAVPSPEPSSLVGKNACTMTCKGDSSQKCGGRNMYNLYAATQVTGILVVTKTGQWSVTPPTSTVN